MSRYMLPPPRRKSLDQYNISISTVKSPLSKLVRDPNLLSLIDDIVVRVNKIVINTYQFLKLYLLHLHCSNQVFPIIDDNFILLCMSVLTIKNNCGRHLTDANDAIKKDLQTFYTSHYYPLNPEKIDARLIRRILAYEATDMVKNITNNIKANYINRLQQFVNSEFKTKERIKKIKDSNLSDSEKRIKTNLYYTHVRKIKQDLLAPVGTSYISASECHAWLNHYKPQLVPNKQFEENLIYYDLKAQPLDYLQAMFNLDFLFEQSGIKLFHALPLRSSIKPCYITLDTSILITLFETENKQFLLSNVTQVQEKIWDKYFLTENTIFKQKNFFFHNMIKTDGVGASILFLRKDLIFETFIPKPKKEVEELYIDEIPITDDLKAKKIVGIDPNKGDIIYCMDENRKTFRYTANQRRFEIGSKKYAKYLWQEKQTVMPRGYTIQSCETLLSKHSGKTCDFEKFKEYITYKTEINNRLYRFYHDNKTRKFKFNRYINTQRSEANMINNFRKKYGEPSNTIIAFGDHEQKKQMKYHEPTKDKGMRKLFRKHGYQVYLVDEFRTSCRCNKCGSEVDKFMWRPSPRPWKKGEMRSVHGLIRCKNVKCNIKWNRDYNASLNILEIATNAIEGKERPEKLRRGNNSVVKSGPVETLVSNI